MRWALAYPVSFRCHHAPLDRPLTVGMVVDAPHTPGQVVSGDRVVAPSGTAPALVDGVLSPLSGAFVGETYPLTGNALIGSGTPLPETETPWQGLYQGWGQDAIHSGPLLRHLFVRKPAPPTTWTAPRRRRLPPPGSHHPFGRPNGRERPDSNDRARDAAGQDPIGPQIATRKGRRLR
jgi:hypothetical protein